MSRTKLQRGLASFFLGWYGIDRMVVGCYKTGVLKGLSSVFLWLTPIPYIWWTADVGKAVIGSDGYFYCHPDKKKSAQKPEKKSEKKPAQTAKPQKGGKKSRRPKKHKKSKKGTRKRR